MNRRNCAGGAVHDRARGLERTHTINLGRCSGFIRAPLVQLAIKNGRSPRHAPKALPVSALPHLWAVDLQLRTRVSLCILDKESRAAGLGGSTQSQKLTPANEGKST
jgi:hypothetical protein